MTTLNRISVLIVPFSVNFFFNSNRAGGPATTGQLDVVLPSQPLQYLHLVPHRPEVCPALGSAYQTTTSMRGALQLMRRGEFKNAKVFLDNMPEYQPTTKKNRLARKVFSLFSDSWTVRHGSHSSGHTNRQNAEQAKPQAHNALSRGILKGPYLPS